MQKRKKRAVTLLELMVVIFLIGLIGSVVGYNMKGAMDKGRKFKSEQGKARLKEVLELQAELNGIHLSTLKKDEWGATLDKLKASAVELKPEYYLDGWGEKYEIEFNGTTREIEIESPGLRKHPNL